MSELISFDSMVFVWGIKDQCTVGQELMKDRAKIFFKDCAEKNHSLIIPTPVISEILRPMDQTSPEFKTVMQTINERFKIMPFDTATAIKCAQILNDKINDAE